MSDKEIPSTVEVLRSVVFNYIENNVDDMEEATLLMILRTLDFTTVQIIERIIYTLDKYF